MNHFTVEVPVFFDREVNILEFGAIGDGITSNTKAINDAILAVNEAGGGTVVVPAGIFVTGPVELKSNVNFHVSEGALLLFDKNKEEYPLIITNYEGIPRIRATSPIHADHANNIAITGSGVIDGSGHQWREVKKFKVTDRQWQELQKKANYFIPSSEGGLWLPTESILKGQEVGEVMPEEVNCLEKAAPYYDLYRPVMVSLKHCDQVLIEGVTLQNSPAWNVHPFFCNNLTVRNVTIKNPYYAQNGDGIDVESCKKVHIHHSRFEVGDDAICIKSGKNAIARTIMGPTEDVLIHDCVVGFGHGGFVVGSEMSRGVRNVTVRDCTFIETDVGIRFKSAMGRGGVVEDISISNINMLAIKQEAIIFTMSYVLSILNYDEKTIESVNPEDIPYFRNITMDHIICRGAKTGLKMDGLQGYDDTIENITLKDSIISCKTQTQIERAKKVNLENVRFIEM